MSIDSYEALKAELNTLKTSISASSKKTVRDDALRERFRNLYRSWVSSVKQGVEPHLKNKKELFKLTAELEKLAQLTSKYSHVSEYLKRLNRAINLANSLVLYLPPTSSGDRQRFSFGSDLFLPGIPDLSVQLVPNPLVGWRNKMELFLEKNPFDNSVFIMIRYRERNNPLIRAIKDELSTRGLKGILASDHKLTDDLYNPIACLLSCSRGIAVFDQAESSQAFNPNVAYELGMLQLLGRDCLILKHDSLKSLHTDILMKLYNNYSSVSEVRGHIAFWIDGK